MSDQLREAIGGGAQQDPPTMPVPGWAVQLLIDVAVIKSTLGPIKDHETRLRSLERRSWSLAGISAMAGAGVAQIMHFVQSGGAQ